MVYRSSPASHYETRNLGWPSTTAQSAAALTACMVQRNFEFRWISIFRWTLNVLGYIRSDSTSQTLAQQALRPICSWFCGPISEFTMSFYHPDFSITPRVWGIAVLVSISAARIRCYTSDYTRWTENDQHRRFWGSAFGYGFWYVKSIENRFCLEFWEELIGEVFEMIGVILGW